MKYSTRQLEIIEAATKLIGNKGIQNLTTKSLSKEIGFSEPALYRHFKDKTDILISILNYYRANMSYRISEIINGPKNGISKLETIMQFQFDHFTKHPAIVMVIFAETSFQYEKALSDAVLAILNQKRNLIETIIQNGQNDGSIRNDLAHDQLAPIFMGSMRLTVLRWRLNHYQFDLNKEGESLWNTMKTLMSNQ